VRIFLELVNNFHVDSDKITILSQYRAQCSSIQKLLEEIGYEHPNVETVIASQGTYHYVSHTNLRYGRGPHVGMGIGGSA